MNLKFRKPFLAAVLVLLVAVLASQVISQPASGQTATPAVASEFTMSVRRTFGYSMGGDIRGSFRLSVNGQEENITQVVFLLDDQSIGTVTEPPFRLDIHTQNYPEGSHTLSAKVTTLDGSVHMVQGGTYNFVSASQQWAGVLQIFVGIGVVLVLIVGIGFLFTYLTTGKTVKELPLGTERHYGFQGGGVCTRCDRPFSFHWWGLNLGGSKYDRCDYCGKWSSLKRLPLEDLRVAEQAELQSAAPETMLKQPGQEEKFKDMLDDSKYDPD